VVNAVLVIAIALVYLHGNDQIQSVRHNVTILSSSVSDHESRISDLESRISDLETFKSSLCDSFNASSITDLNDAARSAC
jgi:cell division protein FtsL